MITNLFQVSQVAPNSSWNPPEQLAGDVGGMQVAAALNADGRMEMFYIDYQYNVGHVWQNVTGTQQGSFTSQGLFGFTAKQLAVGTNADGTIHVFYIDLNNNIGHLYEAAGLPWQNVSYGGQAKEIVLASNDDGRLELFYIGMNDQIYHNWQTAPNSTTWSWAVFNFKARKLAVAKGADGRLNLVFTALQYENFLDYGIYSVIQSAANSTVWSPSIGLYQETAKDLTFVQRGDKLLELWYIATDDSIRFIPQTGPNSGWTPKQVFGGGAQQLCFSHDVDGRYELFYVGMDGYCYHCWQLVANGPLAGGGGSAGFQASYLASVTGPTGEIVVFFMGYSQPPTATVPEPLNHLLGASNYILYNNGRPLSRPAVTLTVTTNLAIKSDSKPVGTAPYYGGFSCQLNCYSTLGSSTVWQQYSMEYDGTNLYGLVNNWTQAAFTAGVATINNKTGTIAQILGDMLPAGTQLSIELLTAYDGTVLGAVFSVTPPGQAGTTLEIALETLVGVTAAELAPVVAMGCMVVGPASGETVTFSSGAGNLSYYSPAALTPLSSIPPCAATMDPTEETSNATYGELSGNPGIRITQTFGIEA